jgi:hypothetical protein
MATKRPAKKRAAAKMRPAKQKRTIHMVTEQEITPRFATDEEEGREYALWLDLPHDAPRIEPGLEISSQRNRGVVTKIIFNEGHQFDIAFVMQVLWFKGPLSHDNEKRKSYYELPEFLSFFGFIMDVPEDEEA